MNLKKIFALALAVLMLGTLAACGGDADPTVPGGTEASSTHADYTVKVINALGKPYTSGIIVRILKGTEQVAMQKVDETGTYTKNLEKGDYTVELMFTDTSVEYVYDKASATLSADKTTLEISLAQVLSGESTQLLHKESPWTAYHVNVGCTQVALTAGVRNYFLFIPQEAGEYHISVVGQVESLGYYGSPFYMSDSPILPLENGAIVTAIRADMVSHGTGTDVMVLGIDPGTAGDCILSVERVGDPAWSPEDVPYTIYQPTGKLIPYTLPEGATLLDFDLTAATDAYKLVKDGDGFYHLDNENGPMVLVKLGVSNKYMESYRKIMENTGVRAYFYDEKGEFLRREDYFDCLVAYIGREKNRVNPVAVSGVMDPVAGVYPLTDDLMYIIQNHGRHSGWFDLEGNASIFRDADGNPVPGINPEIAWLFMCCYIAQ